MVIPFANPVRSAVCALDLARFDQWAPWLAMRLDRFGASGQRESAQRLTVPAIRAILCGEDLLFSAAVEVGEQRGIAVVAHARWEENVLERPIAKVVVFVADSHVLSFALARALLLSCMRKNVALVSFTPGNSPAYIHAALNDAGFHVSGQSLTVRADLEEIAPAVARIPIRGDFRTASEDDADAIENIARRAFTDARFVADPHFPREWGEELMAQWSRNLVSGGADEVIVAMAGRCVLGFATMTLDIEKRKRTPELLAVDPHFNGMGVGAMLVRKMIDWYRMKGVRVFVGTTEKSNVAINLLYSKLGFTVLDCNLVYHASPALSPLREQLVLEGMEADVAPRKHHKRS